jgi:hypothetical protein
MPSLGAVAALQTGFVFPGARGWPAVGGLHCPWTMIFSTASLGKELRLGRSDVFKTTPARKAVSSAFRTKMERAKMRKERII